MASECEQRRDVLTALRIEVSRDAMAKTNARSAHTRVALMEATLRVAAASGIASVSYRRVVTEAGMSLGTASYHFDDFNDLLLESFAHFVKKVEKRYRKKLREVSTKDELVEAVFRVIEAMSTDEQDTVLVLTLYSEAARNPDFADLVKSWSKEVKSSLAHVVDDATATKLELIWDGALLQRAVFDHGLSDDEIRQLIRAAITEA
ncbi:MAG: TetR family transcriptional regulator [Candidatus Leucobacter sulfamidivorax]|jgi:DNA-binding transcriptional regulator YbjK|nr:TetR family transcriptional regulator [Candidatus Leucobacter sulfamidivorax]